MAERDKRARFQSDVRAHGIDNAGAMISGDLVGKMRLLRFGIEVLDEQEVARVDRGGNHPDQHLAVANSRHGYVVQIEHVPRRADCVKHDCFHLGLQ
ncbi:MAG: hypothetical protein E5W98_17950 [Mesorhizobium sp.]|nr:MAG: hypothetical protein E5W98_17950 [Mesorhizobium sp.]